jgi:HK97 family phage portal protein
MSGLIQLHLAHPEYFAPQSKGGLTVLDLADARMTADYESGAPTGVSMLPSMADVESWENLLIGIRSESGQLVTPERARRCATVLAIMRGLSEDTARLPVQLFKRGAKEDTIVTDHPVHRILNVAPNAFMTPMEMHEHLMMDAMMWGNWFHLLNFSQDYDTLGELESIWPLQAGYVTRRWREMDWTFTDPTTGISGNFQVGNVWRGTILSSNGIDGSAITLLARDAIGLLLAAEQQGARLFKQGVQTDLVVSSPESMDDDTKKQLRSSFMQRHAGSEQAFMPILAEGGMTINKIGLTAVESQYLEAREYQVADIARVFRYPEVLLGGGTKGKTSTYASAEQFFESYTKHTLGPWTIRKEQTIQRDMLSRKEQSKYYLKTDYSGLLMANETARIANWNAKIQGGWAQPAEARRAEGLPWKDGLEYFSTPSGSTGTVGQKPGPQLPDSTQTDQSGKALPRRVAAHFLSREAKALQGQKQDADSFYTNFGAYIEGFLPEVDSSQVRAYLEMRRNTPAADRFTTQYDAAMSALISLSQGGTL